MADAKVDGVETVPEDAAAATATADATTPPPALPEMRSVTLTGYGGIRMVKVLKTPEVTPKEGEVTIRVKAGGLNFLDLALRQGAIENPPKTPLVMGLECAGEVDAVGENVDGFAVGDRVIGIIDNGAWAELVAIPAQFVYKMPPNMSFQDGAALFMNYVTAYMLLFDIGGMRPGQNVLVHSVGGGVGHALCQLCRTMDDITVFGTASYSKHDEIKNNVDHLYDHVVDYTMEVRKISPEGVDLVLDCLCGEDTNKGIGLLKPLGKYVLYGSSNIVTGETKSFFSFAKAPPPQQSQPQPSPKKWWQVDKISFNPAERIRNHVHESKTWWQVDKISPIKLFDENKTICGFNLKTLLFKQNRHDYIRGVVTQLFKMYNEGKIRPRIDSAWAFEDVGEAMQKMHDRKNIGKVILDPSLPPKAKQNAASPADSNSSDPPKKDESTE